jgi:hypothetical protein
MTSNEFMNFYFVYLLYNKQPMDEKKPELTAEDILEAKIIARLRKQVKHVPSEKQQKHIDKLAQAKKGTKYVKKVEPKAPTQDTQDIPVLVEKKVKKPAKQKVEPKVPQPQSTCGSDSSEETVPKKRLEKKFLNKRCEAKLYQSQLYRRLLNQNPHARCLEIHYFSYFQSCRNSHYVASFCTFLVCNGFETTLGTLLQFHK